MALEVLFSVTVLGYVLFLMAVAVAAYLGTSWAIRRHRTDPEPDSASQT